MHIFKSTSAFVLVVIIANAISDIVYAIHSTVYIIIYFVFFIIFSLFLIPSIFPTNINTAPTNVTIDIMFLQVCAVIQLFKL